jgi:hypothetical protein
MRMQGWTRATSATLAALALGLLAGCATVAQTNQLVGALATSGLTMTPNADLEQTYYLGSFDPQNQVPPAVYRIRVRGQASVLSATRFASSWVPAEVVDALTGSISLNVKDGSVEAQRDASFNGISTGRGMVMFGPEGFREAPRNHRLVVIMGTSPEAVEQAFSSALGTVAKVRTGQSAAGLDRNIIELLFKLGGEKQRLRSIQSPGS